MATQTEHLGLHQWEPEDSFLREDFNQDFAKIDAGVGALQDWTAHASAAGSYEPTPAEPIELNLGFRPKLALFLFTNSEGANMVVAMENTGVEMYYQRTYGRTSMYMVSCFAFTDTGIHINKSCVLNTSNISTVRYVAFR